MKIVHVISLVFLVNSFIFAQSPTGKGAYTINGSISYSSQTEGLNPTVTNFVFNPQFGYFFIDNVYAAISLNYSSSSNGTSAFAVNSQSEMFGIGPAVRYYFSAKKIKPFLGLGYFFNRQIIEQGSRSINADEWKFTIGADYFVTNSFAVEGAVIWSRINYKYDNYPYGIIVPVPSSDRFEIGVGLSYFIN